MYINKKGLLRLTEREKSLATTERNKPKSSKKAKKNYGVKGRDSLYGLRARKEYLLKKSKDELSALEEYLLLIKDKMKEIMLAGKDCKELKIEHDAVRDRIKEIKGENIL